MSQITNIINVIFPYVALIAVAFVAIYPSLKQINPSLAEKMDFLYQIAQSIVVNQSKRDVPGQVKKETATKQLLEQSKKANTELTKETAESIIEDAYDTKINNQKGENENEKKL